VPEAGISAFAASSRNNVQPAHRFRAIGHCVLIVLAGTFAGALRSYLRWSDSSPGVVWIRRACGVAVIVAAVALVL